ncbi:hypothetical protein LJC42_00275 [Eubacteriales bacterium OttesenSCG-928-K08]|nr:hypothetical protein [Eubacteriales bacterium OttesenSCG-928-K08]
MPKQNTIKKIIPDNEWQGLLSHREARAVRISAEDIVAVDGKKIVPAGSILGSADVASTILQGNAAAKIVNDGTAEGIAVNTVDVTDGDCEVAMAYVATASTAKMPVAPSAEAIAALSRITFMDV